MARLRSLLGSRGESRLQVVELRPPEPRGSFLRYVVGDWSDGSPEPLEQDHGARPEGPVPAVAADDEKVLWRALGEACQRAEPAWEGPVRNLRARVFALPHGLRRKVESALEDAQVRPLVSPEGNPRWAVVPLSDPALRLRAVHRAVRGLPNFEEGTFLRLVADYARVFDLEASLETAPGRAAALERLAELSAGRHAVLAVLPGGRGKILRFRHALELANIRAMPRSPTLRALDLVMLNALVLQTVLGVQEPDAPRHPNVVPVPSLEDLALAAVGGELQVGFALNPPPLGEVRAVMEARERLPARTLTLDPEPVFPAEALSV